MGMLDDAFKKTPDKGISPTRKRMQSTSLVPYGTGRQHTTKIPLVTPPPKMSTAVSIFSPKQVTVRRPAKQNKSSGFDFNNPFGTKASQPSGFGSNVGSSQPLGSSSGIKAGTRHKGKSVGGFGVDPRRGERSGGLSFDDTKRAAKKVAQKTGITYGIETVQGAGRLTKRGGKAVGQAARGVAVKYGKIADTPASSFRSPAKRKERKSISKQFRKGIHNTLFKGKRRLI